MKITEIAFTGYPVTETGPALFMRAQLFRTLMEIR